MEHIATILGVTLPNLSARNITLRSYRKIPEIDCMTWENHRDAILFFKKQGQQEADDETASTLSTSASDLSFSSNSVTFADNVIAEVRYRPYTTLEEKYALFYNEHDYAEFRRECYSGKRRIRQVSFAHTVVSQVHVIPVVEDSAQMFYTETELQE